MHDEVKAERARYAHEVGGMLQRIRKAASLTQEQLGQKLGTSTSFVVRLEGGSRGADIADVMVWARACGTEFRALGLIEGAPPEGEDGPVVSEISALARRLNDIDAQLLLALARRLAGRG